MIKSKEVLNILEEEIDPNNYISFFIAGSLPNKLEPNTDFDLFFVIKSKKVQEFFSNVTTIVSKIIRDKSKLTYSFFRGPLKYKDKALLHFIVYTDSLRRGSLTKREQFINEDPLVLKSLLKKSKIILEKNIR